MDNATILLLLNAFSTWFLVGLIWTIQLVHYPLFRLVGKDHFTEYQHEHQNSISLIVGPSMLVEAISAILLAFYLPPGVSKLMVWVGIGLVVLVWVSTAAIQVPCHNKLIKGFDERAHGRLVKSNWIRTIAWTIRGGLTVWMLLAWISPT